MGLTIHFTLVAPPETDALQARDIVRRLRRQALGFKQRGRVDKVFPLKDDPKALRWGRDWLFRRDPHHPNREFQAEIFPLAGFVFPVLVGADCEPLWMGLCRYPLTVLLGDQRQRTRLRGWRLTGFCKTQYASLHGWDHFQRCHTAVIDLLAGARRLGLSVEIHDEGDYWPSRDLKALRQNLEELNGAVAAAAGALKDAAGDDSIHSPIFAHPQFERLEAAGVARAGPVVEAMTKAVSEE